jgi:alpha-glucosidase
MLGGLLAAGAGAVAAAGVPAAAVPAAAAPGGGPGTSNGVGHTPFPDAAAVMTAPGGRARIGLWIGADGPRWAATYDDQTVMNASVAGLQLANGQQLGPGARVRDVTPRRNRGTWQPVYGRNATVSDDYEERRLALTDPSTGIQFSIVARAYDAGVALRYELEAATAPVDLAAELTTFALPAGSTVYGSWDEDSWVVTTPASVPVQNLPTTDSGRLFDNPVTAVTTQGVLACLCEAARSHYPRMMLAGGTGDTLSAHLMQFAGRSGTDPAVTSFSVTAPFTTPWRVLVLGSDGAELIDHADLVPTLAEPSTVDDTSWIKPGKAMRITTLNTQGALACIDFAVKRNLSYVEFDAGWYGPEANPSSDPTKPIAAIDMPQIIAYGKSNGVGVILYVNRIAMSESLFALYEEWGVAGLKPGFIFDGTQAQTDQVNGFAEMAARHHLLVDMHDDLRPSGLERTYPNWILLEGVRGNEHFPTATHNVTLPFSRNIAGPMDYTNCLSQPRDQTTDAHQMAMLVVYYSPLVFVYWYDTPAKYATGNWPQLPWYDAVPTAWDESRALAGEIGQYVVMARRSGTTWYLGAMNNEQRRILDVPLTFLGDGTWKATVYADQIGTQGIVHTPDVADTTPVAVSTTTVTSATTLSMQLAPSGGQAVILARS